MTNHHFLPEVSDPSCRSTRHRLDIEAIAQCSRAGIRYTVSHRIRACIRTSHCYDGIVMLTSPSGRIHSACIRRALGRPSSSPDSQRIVVRLDPVCSDTAHRYCCKRGEVPLPLDY